MGDPSSAPTQRKTRPLWRRVLDDLEVRIAAGEFAERFPTDRELTEHYGVSRHTVRQAVGSLSARGLVDRQRGRGSFLAPPRIAQPTGMLYSLFRAVEERGIEQRSRVLALARTHDAGAAGRLGLAPDAELVLLERIRFAGDDPLALDRVWLPADVGAPILGADFSRTALYDELQWRAGVRITAVEEALEPLLPDDATRGLLQLEPDEALLRVRRTGWWLDRRVEVRLTLVRGQRFVYTSTWSASDPAAT